MGNCFNRADTHPSSTSSGRSKVTSKTSSSSGPSTLTCSTPSTLTAGSGSEKTVPESRPVKRSEFDILSSTTAKPFTFSELKNCTQSFSSLIGEGGFGYVYKGWIDEISLSPSRPGSGITVAVKKLKPEGFQGHKEWLTEVDYLGKLHHPNLVNLIGYCADGDNRLLVYEFMPKGSLETHLFRKRVEPLSWAIRMKIAAESARGLAFLHNNADFQIIYRDVKASNILLDMDFNAKLSDFGLAKDGPTGGNTHVSTQVMGTHGYAAPEYIATGRLTVKADVYSFGVVLLELLTGRKAIDRTKVGIEQNLVDWAKLFSGDRRKMLKLVDPRLDGRYRKNTALALANLAFQCLGNEAKRRPDMSQVLATLEQLQDHGVTANNTNRSNERLDKNSDRR